jgi:hypothetical protein
MQSQALTLVSLVKEQKKSSKSLETNRHFSKDNHYIDPCPAHETEL